jgi:molecular chaperone HtpG
MPETHVYDADVQQVLSLLVHSVYRDPEIYLRELISNASDAISKADYGLKSGSFSDDSEVTHAVQIHVNRQNGTMTISDAGVGMTHDELVENLGRIAHSGTKKFIESFKGKSQDQQLIGQFGIGFYSAFLVADHVTVHTRSITEPAGNGYVWSSSGEGEYQIEQMMKPTRGTCITLHMREGKESFLQVWNVESLIKKYSDFIAFPIELSETPSDKEKEEQAKAKEEAKKNQKDGDDSSVVETDQEEENAIRVVNQGEALWRKPKKDLDDAQYKDMFEQVVGLGAPLKWLHKRFEGGALDYTVLLFIPEKAPFDLWMQEHKRGLKLYIQRVFIMDDAEQFLPHYLRFVKGVVDTNDLPLNLSREVLQSSEKVRKIKSSCVKALLQMLEDMAKKETELYQKFWDTFGMVLKEGVGEDFANREKIVSLARFSSTHKNEEAQTVSLDDYVGRMQKGQEIIYYLVSDGFQAAQSSPHLEIFKKKGIEVVLLHERIDEWFTSHVTEYKGKKLQSVARGDLSEPALKNEEDKKAHEDTEKAFESVVKQMQTVLKDEVKSVSVSKRLTDSPSCLIADQNDMSTNLKRLLEQTGQAVPESKPILELNPEHPLVLRLKETQADDQFASLSSVLFDQALLAEGGQLKDPARFVRTINQLLVD